MSKQRGWKAKQAPIQFKVVETTKMEKQTSPNKVSSFTTWASTTVGIFLPCVNLGMAMIFGIKIIKFNLENKWRRIYLHIGTTDRNRHSKQKNKNKESFERWLTKKHG